VEKHNKNSFYLIEGAVEFWPALCKVISCKSREEFTLQYPASYCLLSLIKAQPEIISQSDLMVTGWGERASHVSANTFYQSILNLRKALKEAGLAVEIIRTIPRKGLKIPVDITIIEEKRKDETKDTSTVESNHAIFYDTPRTNDDSLSVSNDGLAETNDRVDDALSYDKNALHHDETRHDKKPALLRRNLVLYSYVIVCSLMIVSSVFYINEKLSGMTILNSYTKTEKTLIPGCKIYWNSNAVIYSRHENFIKEHPPNCSELKRVYVSAYLNSTQLSMLQCRFSGVINAQPYCTSSFYVKL